MTIILKTGTVGQVDLEPVPEPATMLLFGMGLSVVHGIVKSYGGSIYVHSRPGEGCTFEILIPALERAVMGEAVFEEPIPTGSESILFVDDETMILDIVKKCSNPWDTVSP